MYIFKHLHRMKSNKFEPSMKIAHGASNQFTSESLTIKRPTQAL